MRSGPRSTQRVRTATSQPKNTYLVEAPTAVPRASLKDSDAESHTITLKVPISFKSWGERAALQLRPAGPDTTTVEVTSTASFPLTLADYGKNAQNVQQIVDWLANQHRGADRM